MDSMPLVTVVIPTYKRPHLVGRAIDAVRRQTYRNLEILIVDDGSHDDTERVVRAVPDERVRYISHARNRGLPAARNTGIDAAQGEFLAFLDDDDDWRDDKVELQLQAIRSCDAVLCTAVAGGRRLRVHRNPVVSLDDLRRGSFDPSSLLAKTAVLRHVRFDENLRHGEDWDAFIRIAKQHSIGWVQEPLLFYNDGEHVRMTTEPFELSGESLAKRTAVLRKHRDFFGEEWYRFHLAGAYLAYVARRPNKMARVSRAARVCGVRAVVAVLLSKLRGRAVNRWRFSTTGQGGRYRASCNAPSP